MEQSYDAPRLDINRAEIAPLEVVAYMTGPRQIFFHGRAALLAGDNVIRFMGEANIALMNQTRLASVPSPLPHDRSEFSWHIITHYYAGLGCGENF